MNEFFHLWMAISAARVDNDGHKRIHIELHDTSEHVPTTALKGE